MALLVMLTTLYWIFVETRSGVAAGAVGAVLVLTLREFLFPQHYALDERGATIRSLLGTNLVPWRRVRGASVSRGSLYLRIDDGPRARWTATRLLLTQAIDAEVALATARFFIFSHREPVELVSKGDTQA